MHETTLTRVSISRNFICWSEDEDRISIFYFVSGNPIYNVLSLMRLE